MDSWFHYKMGGDLNISLMQKYDFDKIWVGSWINCCSPNWDVQALILETSYVCFVVAISIWWLLISPSITIKWRFMLAIVYKLSLTLSANISKMPCDWLGEQYKYIKLHILPANDISKFMHFSKHWIFNNRKARECL